MKLFSERSWSVNHGHRPWSFGTQKQGEMQNMGKGCWPCCYSQDRFKNSEFGGKQGYFGATPASPIGGQPEGGLMGSGPDFPWRAP